MMSGQFFKLRRTGTKLLLAKGDLWQVECGPCRAHLHLHLTQFDCSSFALWCRLSDIKVFNLLTKQGRGGGAVTGLEAIVCSVAVQRQAGVPQTSRSN